MDPGVRVIEVNGRAREVRCVHCGGRMMLDVQLGPFGRDSLVCMDCAYEATVEDLAWLTEVCAGLLIRNLRQCYQGHLLGDKEVCLYCRVMIDIRDEAPLRGRPSKLRVAECRAMVVE